MGTADTPPPQRARQRRLRRVVAVLLGIDLALVLIGASLVAAGVRPWSGGHALRGSKAPSGQYLPDISRVAGVTPSFPAPGTLRGHGPVVVVATCVDDCPPGEVLGGFLRRLGTDGLGDARLEVVGWGGDVRNWAREWDVPDQWTLHQVDDRHAALVQDAFHASDSSLLVLYDPHLRWRTTYHVGLLDPDDVRHDVEELAQ